MIGRYFQWRDLVAPQRYLVTTCDAVKPDTSADLILNAYYTKRQNQVSIIDWPWLGSVIPLLHYIVSLLGCDALPREI